VSIWGLSPWPSDPQSSPMTIRPKFHLISFDSIFCQFSERAWILILSGWCWNLMQPNFDLIWRWLHLKRLTCPKGPPFNNLAELYGVLTLFRGACADCFEETDALVIVIRAMAKEELQCIDFSEWIHKDLSTCWGVQIFCLFLIRMFQEIFYVQIKWTLVSISPIKNVMNKALDS